MFLGQIIAPPSSFSLLDTDIEQIFRSVARMVPIPQAGTINIAFLEDDEIQRLNMMYRGVDKNTDVLSFHYFEHFDTLSEDEVAGEIVLSESKVLTQAAEHHHTPLIETQILILHGLLHILGFDHETDEDYEKMWEYEGKIRDAILL